MIQKKIYFVCDFVMFSLTDLTLDFPTFDAGWVWLVGAGPGDPCLLTLHAVNALRQADIVIYDALVSPSVIDFAGSFGSELEYAGKRGGKPSPSQRDISLRLIELADSGKRVCRLKGGDPFVFARGGEEAMSLASQKIPFRIIPGISSGIGGLAYAGIPLTHRTINHSVTFLTGHNVDDPSIDWNFLSRSPVLVLYMALSHIQTISSRLISSGRSPSELIAFVCGATTNKQVVHESTLGSVSDGDIPSHLEAPSIIVIGDVVRLREHLNWRPDNSDGTD